MVQQKSNSNIKHLTLSGMEISGAIKHYTTNMLHKTDTIQYNKLYAMWLTTVVWPAIKRLEKKDKEGE